MSTPRWLPAATVIGLLVTWAGPVVAENATDLPLPNAAPNRTVDFNRDVKPIFAKRCFACHGPDMAEGGLRLSGRDTALAELDSGDRAIVPGKPDEGVLLYRVGNDDESERMPPEGKPLSPGEIATIRQWIAEGAEFDKHWAFVPLDPQSPPKVNNGAWVENGIDAFILARLERAGLRPAPPADKIALLRRLYYDLTGLPPTLDEVDAFLADDSPDAYEKVVDRLLKSPRYGERWGRHWLDLVRYAETNSYERDGVKPNAWRYRDYVIRSLNDDKPYDQFIREQLAGDELPEVTPESITATGYYRLGIWDDEPADPAQAYFDEMDDIIATTGQVFLGLTINCARCHDHKIDPIPQTDYYKMLSFFRELTSYGSRGDQLSGNQTDISPPGASQAHDELERREAGLRKRIARLEERGIAKMSGEDQRAAETGRRKRLLEEKLKDFLDDEDSGTYQSLRQELDDVQTARANLPPREMVLSVARCVVPPPPTYVLRRGSARAPGDEVQPGFPELFGTVAPPLPTPAKDAHSSGRRLLLANWIASPDNLLTARVMVNRVWQHHFGRGLVRSPNNFGGLGTPPTHPELLDWLAAQFIDNGWRLKPLHKLIVMSSAYRMSSEGNEMALAQDPTNDLFWRFDLRRLSAEEIRDSIHAVSGRLNLKMYGPGYYPEISDEVKAGQSVPGSGWGNSSADEQARRSVYIHVKRSLLTPILETFDFAEPDSSCEARFVTTLPTQALAMINSKFLHDQAAEFAGRLRREAGDDTQAQVRLALRLTTLREADDANVRRGLDLIETLKAKHNLDADQALEYYCLMVLNLNEFVYLD